MIEDPVPVLSFADIVWRLGLALLLVLANGFFVAAEFALVGSRRTRIEALAEKGNRAARIAQNAIHHLDHYISGTQLGITLASLALGWVGESTFSTILIQVFGGLGSPWNRLAGHAVAGTLAFACITFLHIVLGELAPKSLALLFPERVSLWTAGPLVVFSKILSPFIHLLNASANLILRGVGLTAPHEAERVHRPEELEMLITQSYEHGLLAEEPVEMIRAVFDLSETSAAEVMTPRTDIIAVVNTATVEQVKDAFLESGHSRLPVFEGSVDHIIGVVLARDFWPAYLDRRQTGIRTLIRAVPFVPESKDLEHLLHEMRRAAAHIAVVLDEYGGTAGIVTVEDLVEEIVGEIKDEHETEVEEIQEMEDGQLRVAGRALVGDLNERFDLHLPEDDYTTVAGYVMGELGRVAVVDDEVSFPAGSLRVLEMSGRRIEWLELRLARREGGEGGVKAGTEVAGARLDREGARKAFHIASVGLPLLAWLLPHAVALAGLAAIAAGAVVVDTVRLRLRPARYRFLRHTRTLLRVHERHRVTGATYMAVAYALAALLFPLPVAVAAMLYNGLGDAAAALVGKRYGHWRTSWGKSWEGFAAGLSVDLAVGLLLPGISLPGALLGALVAATIEFLPLPLDDNLRVTLGGGVGILLGQAVSG